MKRALVTGARGFLGAELSALLLQNGIEVNAMYRPRTKLRSDLIEHPRLMPVKADILNKESLKNAMKYCDTVFHLAAFAKPWHKNRETFFEINVLGTKNVLDIAVEIGVKRVILVSTAGTFGPQKNETLVSESTRPDRSLYTDYERTKFEALLLAEDYLAQGLEVVTVSPTRVFGPGEMSVSNAVTKIVHDYIYKGFRYVPGNGNSMGNYVFVSAVVQGIFLAAQKGRSGENYILGGYNLTYRELYNAIGDSSGKRHQLISVPLGIMIAVSWVMEKVANITGRPPAITPPFVRKYSYNWGTDISKAQKHLNYDILPFQDAMNQTISWIRENNS
jgi:nucleoside-diphosphate-sugar epimerase